MQVMTRKKEEYGFSNSQAALWASLESETQRLDLSACLDRLPLNQPAVFLGQFVYCRFDDAAFDVVEVGSLLLRGIHRGAEVLNGVFGPAGGLEACQQLQKPQE